ncbi:MAG: hypothetical protein ACK47M_00155, partial [Caldilinea sp.]
MTYYALDSYSVIDYLRATPSLANVLDLKTPMHAREVGDGNLNLVFIVEGETGEQSVVVKQALPYLRVAGESWPLTRERMRFETQALIKHNELAPGLAPRWPGDEPPARRWRCRAGAAGHTSGGDRPVGAPGCR